MSNVQDLSERLRAVFDYEIQRGNQIARIDRPAGSNCPLAIIFSLPLDISGYSLKHGTLAGVRIWENKDEHYPLEAGYFCESTHHAIAGPTPKK